MARQPTLEQDRATYLDLEAKRLAIVEAQDDIKARIRAAYKVGTSVPFGDDGKVSLSPNRRFDPATAETVIDQLFGAGRLTDVDVESMQTTIYASALVKRKLSPEDYERCMKESGDPRVTIS